jgi:hypothetical protein
MKLANGSTGIPSYLTWSFPASGAPYQINNIPGAWMNSRTLNLFATYSPAKGGGFVEENTLTSDPQTVTPAIADVSVAVAMGGWNQNQWGDSRFSTAPILTNTKYIYGDYDPTTLPGKISGAKSDAVTGEGSGIQVGITKFTDLTEDFSQTAHLSTIDNLPIGSLIWNDAQLAAFSSTADLAKVNAGYVAKGGTALVTGIKNVNNLPGSYSLSQNYPNPFNPTTNIKFTLQKASNVTLAIYNVLGQKVSTLVSSFMREGSYSFQFDGSKLASGVYFYRIDAGSFNSVKKMILMK